MKKIITLLLSLFLLSTTQVLGYQRGPISAQCDVEMTKEAGYPVIQVTSKHSEDLLVEYNYHLTEPEDTVLEQVQLDFTISPGETKILHLKDLAFLKDSGKTRNIWFNYTMINVRKPIGITVTTPIFNSPTTVHPELG